MKVAAAILAAGRGTRFGGDKTEERLGNRKVWEWSFDTFRTHPEVDHVFLVTTPEKASRYGGVVGGDTRQASSYEAVRASEGFDVLLIHDAARPFVSHGVIDRVLEGIGQATAAGAALPVSDTIKEMGDGRIRTLDRSHLWAMQTPQGAYWDVLNQAHLRATAEWTDEMALVEALGVHPMLVNGDPANFKITTPEDLVRARSLVESETRTGIGYDIHAFSDDPKRTLFLGGVAFEGSPALEGHSDADVLLHAMTDALLGAAGMGDIGLLFPNTDPRWKDCPSLHFLESARDELSKSGWRVVHLDATVIAETPKVMARASEIRHKVADALRIEVDRVSLKATTNEGLGAIGRSEGIAAFAVATIRR
ncbi:MAG TPA: 2-C-methyl-D-erythritol 2,4-cyclodiphosphate synthase [Fimbriimonas sp.]